MPCGGENRPIRLSTLVLLSDALFWLQPKVLGPVKLTRNGDFINLFVATAAQKRDGKH